jgi:uncharacterized protein
VVEAASYIGLREERVQIENEFSVAATPERVYAFLLDVNRVVGCVPGAELSEVVDPETFKGRVRIKVGPVSVAYAGTARIAERDEAAKTATLEGEGREEKGPGSARARSLMRVEAADGGGSRVVIATDFTVAGRVAQFGRGLMEDVSRSLVNQMAACIKSQLEGPAPSGAGETLAEGRSEAARSEAASGEQTSTVAPAKPVNALALLWSVIVARVRRLFSRPEAS